MAEILAAADIETVLQLAGRAHRDVKEPGQFGVPLAPATFGNVDLDGLRGAPCLVGEGAIFAWRVLGDQRLHGIGELGRLLPHQESFVVLHYSGVHGGLHQPQESDLAYG